MRRCPDSVVTILWNEIGLYWYSESRPITLCIITYMIVFILVLDSSTDNPTPVTYRNTPIHPGVHRTTPRTPRACLVQNAQEHPNTPNTPSESLSVLTVDIGIVPPVLDSFEVAAIPIRHEREVHSAVVRP